MPFAFYVSAAISSSCIQFSSNAASEGLLTFGFADYCAFLSHSISISSPWDSPIGIPFRGCLLKQHHLWASLHHPFSNAVQLFSCLAVKRAWMLSVVTECWLHPFRSDACMCHTPPHWIDVDGHNQICMELLPPYLPRYVGNCPSHP